MEAPCEQHPEQGRFDPRDHRRWGHRESCTSRTTLGLQRLTAGRHIGEERLAELFPVFPTVHSVQTGSCSRNPSMAGPEHLQTVHDVRHSVAPGSSEVHLPNLPNMRPRTFFGRCPNRGHPAREATCHRHSHLHPLRTDSTQQFVRSGGCAMQQEEPRTFNIGHRGDGFQQPCMFPSLSLKIRHVLRVAKRRCPTLSFIPCTVGGSSETRRTRALGSEAYRRHLASHLQNSTHESCLHRLWSQHGPTRIPARCGMSHQPDRFGHHAQIIQESKAPLTKPNADQHRTGEA